MDIGIDVGGTFTDGVVLDRGRIVTWSKIPTGTDLTETVRKTLEKLLVKINPVEIKRVVLSTTLITNILAQGKGEPVALLLFPGPGLPVEDSSFAGEYAVLQGALDFKGRVVEEIDYTQVREVAANYAAKGYRNLVLACKFSQRNPAFEEEIVKELEKHFSDLQIMGSHEVSGLLNWVRRANGAVYTLACRKAFEQFVGQMEKIFKNLDLACPIQILKADGGTMPLGMARRYPLEAIFSGPAASALGAAAAVDFSCTVIDVGGTTTDLALVLQGTPLLAEKGARLLNCPLPVRALAVSSLALGGDTSLQAREGQISLGERQGPALCLGGPCLTVTDVLVFLGYSEIGSPKMVAPYLEDLASEFKITPAVLGQMVLSKFMSALEEKLEEMFKSWEEEPAYRIWQVLSRKTQRPQTLVCLGGPAQALGQFWGKEKGRQVLVPPCSILANAIGAALSRTTLYLEYQADTEQMTYSTNIGGLQGALDQKLRSLDEAREKALNHFNQVSAKWGLEHETLPEILYEESFNIVRGWSTMGKIFQVGLQTAPGIRYMLAEEADAGE